MRGSGQSGGDCIAWQPIDYMGQCSCVCVTEGMRVRERVDEWEVREKKGGELLSVVGDQWDEQLCTGLKVFSVRKRKRL